MEYSKENNTITCFDKKMSIDTVVNKLAKLNATQVSAFFESRDIKLPKKLNSLALFSAINGRLRTIDSTSLTKDAYSKMTQYKNFTEFQLENLFTKICNEEDFTLYRTNLWKLILANCSELNLLDGEVQKAMNSRKGLMDNAVQFFDRLNAVSIDIDKDFDAYPINKFTELSNETFGQEEIRNLATKYGFEIPNRLKKDELLDYVKRIMKSKRKLTVALDKELSGMTVVQLNSFCMMHQIDLSANLKKNELAYLLVFLVKEAKFETLPIKKFETLGIKPATFKVKIENADVFGRGEPKKVLFFDDEVEPEENSTVVPLMIDGKKVYVKVPESIHKKLMPEKYENSDTAKKETKDLEPETPVEEKNLEEKVEQQEPKPLPENENADVEEVKNYNVDEAYSILLAQKRKQQEEVVEQAVDEEPTLAEEDSIEPNEAEEESVTEESIADENVDEETTQAEDETIEPEETEVLESVPDEEMVEEELTDEESATEEDEVLESSDEELEEAEDKDSDSEDATDYDEEFDDEDDDIDDDDFDFEPEDEENQEALEVVGENQTEPDEDLLPDIEEPELLHDGFSYDDDDDEEFDDEDEEDDDFDIEKYRISAAGANDDEKLENESYDEEFAPKEEKTDPSKEDIPQQDVQRVGMPSPYYHNKKLLSKKKSIITAAVSVVGFAALFILIFVIVKLFS